MAQPTLDDRVAALEQQVARLTELQAGLHQPPRKDWRSTIGMFADDPIMTEVIEEGRTIRERDREPST